MASSSLPTSSTSGQSNVLDPNVRVIAVAAVAERLQSTFKGTTGIDLDELAQAVVDELIDPLARREYESRDAMFMRALEAAIVFAVPRIHELQDQVMALQKKNDGLVVRVREYQNAERRRARPEKAEV